MKQFEQQLADAYARLNMYLNDRLENSEGLANIKFALTNLNALENADKAANVAAICLLEKSASSLIDNINAPGVLNNFNMLVEDVKVAYMTEHFSASTDFASLFSEFTALDSTELKYVITDSIEVPVEEPAAETVVEEPVANEPAAETVVEEPVANEPAANEPAAETVVEEPVANEPAAETVVEEPAAETVVEEPVKPKTRTRKSK